MKKDRLKKNQQKNNKAFGVKYAERLESQYSKKIYNEVIYEILRYSESQILHVFDMGYIGDSVSDHILDITKKVRGYISDIKKKVTEKFGRGIKKKAGKLASESFAKVDAYHLREFQKDISRAVGKEFKSKENEKRIAKLFNKKISDNVKLIKTIPSQYLIRVKNALMLNLINDKGKDNIIKELSRLRNVTKSRANFIARDQMTKFQAALTEIRQTENGIDEYIWNTMMDNLVRPTHASKHGKRFRWDSPPETGHPGEDYGCRCNAIPYV